MRSKVVWGFFLLILIILGYFFLLHLNKKTLHNKDLVIGILPFEGFPDELSDSVAIALTQMFDLKTKVLATVDLPSNAFINVKSPRYRADSLLDWMSELNYEGVDILIGLTKEDISITKYADHSRTKIKEPESKYRDFGIFGLGRVGGGVCVVSSFRLRNGVSEKMFINRLTRISCHEVGHVLGLHHCPEPSCLMNDANESIKTIDKSTGNLCDKCWKEME